MKETVDARRHDRMPDTRWRETLQRVRGEFEEMPCMKLTPAQARTLLGLRDRGSLAVLDRLEREGFLTRTLSGEYIRRTGV